MIKNIFSIAMACTMGIGMMAQVEESKKDTTEIKLGDLKVLVYEDSEPEDTTSTNRNSSIFHTGGRFDIGMNLLLDANNGTDMTGDNLWMDLDYAKSLSWSWYPVDATVNIVKEYVQLGFGAGVQWNNYGLANNVQVFPQMPVYSDTSMMVLDTYVDTTFGATGEAYDFTKNRLRTTYLKVPLMLEFNTNSDEDRSFHVAAGVIGGWRLGSNLKQKYTEDGVSYKNRIKDDFNFRAFTLDGTVRVGYGDFTLFAMYGLTSLFADNRGPEVYPVTVGLSVIAW
ncbi:MAG: hypothetical protein ACI84C_000539 [Flavobacteriales bacterium]|jgi:hypothetical protein